MPLTKERSKKYINRWIKRNNVKRGWIIFGRNEYWHKEIYEKIDYSLDDMKITKKIAYKDLQAFLYEPKLYFRKSNILFSYNIIIHKFISCNNFKNWI